MSFHKAAAFGAFGVCVVLLALYALLITRVLPSQRGASDPTNAWVTVLSVGGLVLALIVVHLVFARKLLRMAREPGAPERP
jgi:cell division protein FtsW (lipid II flippase)